MSTLGGSRTASSLVTTPSDATSPASPPSIVWSRVRDLPGIGTTLIARPGDDQLQIDFNHQITNTAANSELLILPSFEHPESGSSLYQALTQPMLSLRPLRDGSFRLTRCYYSEEAANAPLDLRVILRSGDNATETVAPREGGMILSGGTELHILSPRGAGECIVKLVLPECSSLHQLTAAPTQISALDGRIFISMGSPTAPVLRALTLLSLMPEEKLRVRGGTITFSKLFRGDEDRLFVIGAVQPRVTQGGGANMNAENPAGPSAAVLRVFYQSSSQGVFRVLPAINYPESISICRIPGYDKGPGEEFITPSSKVQAYLARQISNRSIAADIAPEVGQSVVEMITRVNRYPADWLYWKASDDYPRKLISEYTLIKDPTRWITWKEVAGERREPRNIPHPESLRINLRAKAPQFTRGALRTYQTRTSLGGEVTALIYRSYDNSIEYTIFRDRSNRIWFASIAFVRSKLSTLGVPSVGIDAQHLLSPLWEYFHLVPPALRGELHSANQSYCDNSKYLSGIPEIRRWWREAPEAKGSRRNQ